MGTTTREIERKYDGPVGAALPDPSGLPGVASVADLGVVTLDAVYFDTPELRLVARGVTLRRRTGGDDSGWHLKLPAATPDVRTEVRAPLGRRRTVPKSLAVQTYVHTRGAQLAPVVRLQTRRHRSRLRDADGTDLAEIAQDEVTAQLLDPSGEPLPDPAPTEWSELEVELIEGPGSLLDAVEERLVAAGLHRSAAFSKLARALDGRLPAAARPGAPRPSGAVRTAGDAALAYLRQQVSDLTALDPAVRRDEPDAVHRMRVATRRMRSALRTFSRELDRSVTDPTGAELKWLAEVLGLERDREVLSERLDERLAELPAELGDSAGVQQASEFIHNWFTTKRAGARRTLLRELAGARYFALLDTLDALLADPPWLAPAGRPARSGVTRAVRRDHRRLARRVDQALALEAGPDRDVALHEARKAAKRARYAAEAARPVFGKPAKEMVARMKEVQQLLGEHQDSVIARNTLRTISADAHRDGADTFVFGALYQLERVRAAAAEAALPVLWREAVNAVPDKS